MKKTSAFVLSLAALSWVGAAEAQNQRYSIPQQPGAQPALKKPAVQPIQTGPGSFRANSTAPVNAGGSFGYSSKTGQPLTANPLVAAGGLNKTGNGNPLVAAGGLNKTGNNPAAGLRR